MALALYKVLCGKIYHEGRRYAKGDMIELPGGSEERYRNKLQLVRAAPEPETVSELFVAHRGHGNYDVINIVTGEKINDAPLTKKEAEEIAGKGAGDGKPEQTVETAKNVGGSNRTRTRGRTVSKKG